ncbi:MAG: response regulator [Verrucomicrobiales bacterium]|nr:response regulator [Verrucomicrobiales bacterium]
MRESLQILILESDAIVASDLRDTLSRQGYGVLGVEDRVERALQLAADRQPDLLLIDLRLGMNQGAGGDGVSAAKKLAAVCDAQVLFMTGFSSEESFKRAQEVRPAGFLRKPFSSWELQAAVEGAVRERHSDQLQDERGGQFLETLTHLSEGVIASDLDGKITFCNCAAKQMLGFDEQEVLGQALTEVMEVRESGEESEHGSTGRVLLLKKQDGTEIKVVERSTALRDEKGEVAGLLTLFVEWSEKVAGEVVNEGGEVRPYVPFCELFDYGEGTEVKEVEASDAFADERPSKEQMIAGITDPLLTLDGSQLITYANPEANACLGNSEGLLIGQSFLRLFAVAAGEECGVKLAEVRQSGRRQCFEIYDDQSERWFELNVYLRGDGWLILLRDASAKKQESLLELRAHRLEGLSLLARGFTHDFNNLLTVLIGNLSLIEDRYPEDLAFQSEVKASSLAADQARRLVQQLMTFTKGGVPILTETKVAGVLRRVLEQHRKANAKIRYQMRCEDPSLRVRIDPEQIALLLENLVKNAEEAMPQGGHLEAVCELCMESLPEQALGLAGEEEEVSYVVIKIIDSGHGMTEQVVERVFEPYFTTRKEDNASGIGLTVCESIAKAHRGFLTLSSQPGKGTEVSLFLPLQLSKAGEADAGEDEVVDEVVPELYREAVDIKADAPRILILEDEDLIRQLIVRCLGKQGYEVVESVDGEETLLLYQQAMQQGKPFDLVLSDLTIEGGMGGVEMMQRLRVLDPDVKAIVSSGYSDAPAMARPDDYGFVAVLPKPYPPQDLIRVVAQVIGRRGGA